MDEETKDRIHRLKKELFDQKEAVTEVAELVNAPIDRLYPIDLWELSERELDNEMGTRLSFLNDDIDTKPDASVITSHRRLLGKPIILFKRLLMKLFQPYTNILLEKQRRFNDQSVAFHLASFIRFRHNEARLLSLETKLKELEENQELLMDRISGDSSNQPVGDTDTHD